MLLLLNFISDVLNIFKLSTHKTYSRNTSMFIGNGNEIGKGVALHSEKIMGL